MSTSAERNAGVIVVTDSWSSTTVGGGFRGRFTQLTMLTSTAASPDQSFDEIACVITPPLSTIHRRLGTRFRFCEIEFVATSPARPPGARRSCAFRNQ